MFRHFDNRLGHYALLLLAWAALSLPNLGAPSLWDIDEGNNAEAAREMRERGDWVVPWFNWQLRVDKPALLYWLQIGAYEVFGVGEFAARLPSALAALLAVLATYELGRRMFGAAAGLLAGLVLASAALFCAAAHFANPDALLCAFTTLSLFFTWHGLDRHGRLWFVPIGVCQGLAVLTKGPVGLVLPLAVTVLFLAWSRQLRLLLDRRLLIGVVMFTLVVAPWYALVGAETKARFLEGFLLTHNVGRFLDPMENHSGPIYYYLAVLVLGFTPWSIFLGLAIWSAVRRPSEAQATTDHGPRTTDHYRFLGCWIAAYVVFFSLSRTKLPNYILPIYPPVALLTAQFLDRWRRGVLQPPGWAMHLSLACLTFVGMVTAAGLLLASGIVEMPLLRGRRYPGLETWPVLGIVPVIGAGAAWWCIYQQRRNGLVIAVTVTAILFLGILGAGGGSALEKYKAPRALAQALPAEQTEQEIRVATYRYFQPSLVFYCQREVKAFKEEQQALDFLRCELPVYLFVPAPVWEEMASRVYGPSRLLARRRDLYTNCDVVVVTNR